MPLQGLIITCASAAATSDLALLLSFWRVPRRGKRMLLIGLIFLCAVAAYESITHFIWEPRVSAAIRLDIFLIDFPLLSIGLIATAMGLWQLLNDSAKRQT